MIYADILIVAIFKTLGVLGCIALGVIVFVDFLDLCLGVERLLKAASEFSDRLDAIEAKLQIEKPAAEAMGREKEKS